MHHYLQGTTTQVPSKDGEVVADETITGKVGETYTTKASENIENIIEFVQGLIDKGHAYPAENGDVYFNVRSFPGYGKLSHRKVDELLNGVRKDVEEGKHDPIDFALWKPVRSRRLKSASSRNRNSAKRSRDLAQG